MNITIATNYDDWDALYIDGKLWTECHSLSWEHLADALNLNVKIVDATEHLAEYGSCPYDLNELRKGE